jgi:hypothetical protein
MKFLNITPYYKLEKEKGNDQTATEQDVQVLREESENQPESDSEVVRCPSRSLHETRGLSGHVTVTSDEEQKTYPKVEPEVTATAETK